MAIARIDRPATSITLPPLAGTAEFLPPPDDAPVLGVASVEAAASDGSAQPRRAAYAVAVALVAAGGLVGWLIHAHVHGGRLHMAAGYSAFAALFVLAQGIERLLEPFTQSIGGTSEQKQEVDRTTAQALMATGPAKAVANAKAALEKRRAERALVIWGVATALAIAVCTGLHLYLMSSLVDAATSSAPNWAIDMMVTGLVVGSGTKPLHDLVTAIQAKSSATS